MTMLPKERRIAQEDQGRAKTFDPDKCPLITCNRCQMDFLVAETRGNPTKHRCFCGRVFWCKVLLEQRGSTHRPTACVTADDHKRYMEGY